MGEFKHLVVAKFKDGVVVEDIINGMQDLVSQIDVVTSFEWGHDTESQEMLRQGFTHSFLMAFNSKEDYTAFLTHPKHAEFSATFSAAIEKVILLDFPTVLAKPISPSQPAVVRPPSETAAAEPTAERATAEPTVETAVAEPTGETAVAELAAA